MGKKEGPQKKKNKNNELGAPEMGSSGGKDPASTQISNSPRPPAGPLPAAAPAFGFSAVFRVSVPGIAGRP